MALVSINDQILNFHSSDNVLSAVVTSPHYVHLQVAFYICDAMVCFSIQLVYVCTCASDSLMA